MKRIIPLNEGSAHLRFNVDLSGTLVRVRLNWLTRDGYYTVQITRGDETLIAGVGLHPDMDLLQHVLTIPGSLYIEGRVPTVNNLGIENRLVYET